MSNEEKQALRAKVDAIIADAHAKNDNAIKDLAIEAKAMIPPDEDDPQDPGT